MAGYEVTISHRTYSTEHGRITCTVSLSGEWRGIAILECPLPMATAITAAFLRCERPAAFDDDVSDSMGELANMIGGNLKAVLPPGVALSVPTVVEGASYSIRAHGASHVTRVAFDGPDGPFWATFAEVAEGYRQ
jgi:CheY-specific phosphatase CheX